MRSIEYSQVIYRLTEDQNQVLESRKNYFTKLGCHPALANQVATVLTLESYFSEFCRSPEDRAAISEACRILDFELNRPLPEVDFSGLLYD